VLELQLTDGSVESLWHFQPVLLPAVEEFVDTTNAAIDAVVVELGDE
jgi:hypothetical protein